MGSQQSLGGGPGEASAFGNAMALNAGPPMGSVGSTQDLQDLYRRYSSMPMQASPACMLSMHDSAGSISLDEVGRSAARLTPTWLGLHPGRRDVGRLLAMGDGEGVLCLQSASCMQCRLSISV